MLPHDINKEACVLSSILNDENSIHKISDITEEMFYNSRHRKIFSALKQMMSKNIPLNIIDISNFYQSLHTENDIPNYLNELSDIVLTASNIRYFANEIKKLYKRRNLMVLFDNALKSLSDEFQDIDEVVSETFRKSAKDLNENETASISDTVKEYLTRVETQDFYQKTYKTGFKDLDEHLNIKGGKLVIIGARPSHGKSILAKEIALANAKKGMRILIVNLEMNTDEQTERILSSETNIAYSRIMTTKYLTDSDKKTIVETSEKINELNITFSKSYNLSIQKIKSIAISMQMDKGLDMIIIDYLGLIEPDDKRATRERQVSEISRQAKLMAGSLDVPVILLTQLNRECEKRPLADRMPVLSDLRESGSIEQDADIVLFSMIPAKYGIKNINDMEINDNLMLINIAKNRQGMVKNYIKLYFDGTTTKARNYSELQI